MAQTASLADEFPDELPKQHEIVCGIFVRKAVPTFERGALQRRLGVFVDPFLRQTEYAWRMVDQHRL